MGRPPSPGGSADGSSESDASSGVQEAQPPLAFAKLAPQQRRARARMAEVTLYHELLSSPARMPSTLARQLKACFKCGEKYDNMAKVAARAAHSVPHARRKEAFKVVDDLLRRVVDAQQQLANAASLELVQKFFVPAAAWLRVGRAPPSSDGEKQERKALLLSVLALAEHLLTKAPPEGLKRDALGDLPGELALMLPKPAPEAGGVNGGEQVADTGSGGEAAKPAQSDGTGVEAAKGEDAEAAAGGGEEADAKGKSGEGAKGSGEEGDVKSREESDQVMAGGDDADAKRPEESGEAATEISAEAAVTAGADVAGKKGGTDGDAGDGIEGVDESSAEGAKDACTSSPHWLLHDAAALEAVRRCMQVLLEEPQALKREESSCGGDDEGEDDAPAPKKRKTASP